MIVTLKGKTPVLNTPFAVQTQQGVFLFKVTTNMFQKNITRNIKQIKKYIGFIYAVSLCRDYLGIRSCLYAPAIMGVMTCHTQDITERN